MIGHSELARILMAISNDEKLVKNTLSKLAKQFEIKYGENAENEEKDPDHKIKVGLLYDSIVTSSPIVVNDGNFRQIIKERSDKGTHLMLYDRIIADNVIDYYELVFESIAFGEDCYLCLVSPKDNLDDSTNDGIVDSRDNSIDDRINSALDLLGLNEMSIIDNAKELIKNHLGKWKKQKLVNDCYEIDYNEKSKMPKVKAIYYLFEGLKIHPGAQICFQFMESLFGKKIDNKNVRDSWRSSIQRYKRKVVKK